MWQQHPLLVQTIVVHVDVMRIVEDPVTVVVVVVVDGGAGFQ